MRRRHTAIDEEGVIPVSKTIVIAGTSSGLGEAAVFEYAQRGWNVVAGMRNVAVARVAAVDNTVMASIDVTDHPSIGAALGLAGEKFGQLDAVLHVAGYGQVGAIE